MTKLLIMKTTTQVLGGMGFATGESGSFASLEAALESAKAVSLRAGVTSVAVWQGLTKVASVTAGAVEECAVAGSTGLGWNGY